MRRYVWAALGLIVGLAFVGTTVRQARMRTAYDVDFDGVMEHPRSSSRVVTVRPIPPVVGPPTRVAVVSQTTTRKTSRTRSEEVGQPVWKATVTGALSTKNAAYDDAYANACNKIQHDLGLSFWPSREFVEKIRTDYEEQPGPEVLGEKTAQVVLHLEMSREAYGKLVEKERTIRSSERLKGTGRMVALLTVLFGAVAGYVRVDEWTKGYYTGRLRVALVALVGAALAVIANV